ncbi:MAG TPA: SDR family NAD(P)-dependent oxidoreductase [Acidimicrobiia bacterium]|nr:SDR family NAD(P)-dependent oxidoreductase [Acidimicrobiia bacterium]
MKLAGKVVVVTGGGNGIGREVVLELLRRDARVAAVDIRRDSLDETAELAGAGDRLATFVVDITDRAATVDLPGRVIEKFGAVDGVLNVAGIIQPFVKLADLDYDAIERVVDVNLYGTIHVVKAFLPYLLQRPEAHIGNVSSMGGFLPVPGQTVYGATKAAVKLLTEGLYAELLETDVAVSVILSGAVATEITSNSGVAVPVSDPDQASRFPTTSAADAATIILDGIENDAFHIYVGRDSRLMGILSRLAPKRATHLIQRRMRKLLG